MKKRCGLVMLKKIGYVIALLLGFFLIVWLAIYWQHRTYFTGAVRTYVVAQKIPKNSIKNQKIVFNWVNMGQWEEDVSIRHQHHTYQYIYNMSWQDKRVSLSIYDHREGVKDTLAPYPPLEYDR